MSGFAEIKVLWHGTAAEMQRIERASDRATMWAVRQGGRRVKAEAKKAAPVYKGGARRLTGKQQGPMTGPSKPINGLLRSSIGTSKRLRKTSIGGYTNKIAPRGERVHLYSGKIEEQVGYMAHGMEVGSAEMPEIAARAWGRATKSKGGRAR